MTSKLTDYNLKLMFFIFIIPVIILGEFIRILHRVGPYEVKESMGEIFYKITN